MGIDSLFKIVSLNICVKVMVIHRFTINNVYLFLSIYLCGGLQQLLYRLHTSTENDAYNGKQTNLIVIIFLFLFFDGFSQFFYELTNINLFNRRECWCSLSGKDKYTKDDKHHWLGICFDVFSLVLYLVFFLFLFFF